MTSWLVRTFRGRRFDRNPLRRPSDRAETVAGIVLVVAFAVAAPFTVRAAAGGMHAFAQHTRATAIATRHEVTAVTVQIAPSRSGTGTQSWVNATWTAPDGRQRTGQVQVDDGTPKGYAERIWVTGSGDMAPPPLPVSEFPQLAELAAVGAGLGLAILFLVARAAIRHALDRRRMAAWDAGWVVAERRWNRQRW
jgi:hypothetical protein